MYYFAGRLPAGKHTDPTGTVKWTDNWPPSYVFGLEQRVIELERQLQQTHTILPPQSAPIDSSNTRAHQYLTYSMDEPSTRQIDLSPTVPQTPQNGSKASQRLLNEVIRNQMPPRQNYRVRDSTDGHSQSHVLDQLDTSLVSLPKQEAAETLVETYFRFSNLSQPLLFRPHFQLKLDLLHSLPPTIDLARTHTSAEAQTSVFVVLEVFAIALLVLQKQDPSRIPTSLASRYHHTALAALDRIGLTHDVEGVQSLLLTSQYYYHHPEMLTVWSTVGAALRLAVELGLHMDPPPGSLDFIELDIRRRTLWTAYAMDRNISIALGLPTCLADGAISVVVCVQLQSEPTDHSQYPSEHDDDVIQSSGGIPPDQAPLGPKSVCLHVFRWREIQSEMQTVLYQKPPPGYASIDLDQWQQRMAAKINTWYAEMPWAPAFEPNEKRIIENFDLTYYRALLYLYHPAPNQPFLSDASWLHVTDAATNMIKLYRRFFDERRLTIYWQAVEGLSTAGSALLTGFTESPAVRAQLTLQSLRDLIQTCSSVLWAMVEHFPAFKPKRDAFDQLATKVLASLSPGDTSTIDSMQSSGSATAHQPSISTEQMEVAMYGAHTIEPALSDMTDFELAAFNWDALDDPTNFNGGSWV